jgi:hypothetical protein
MGVRYGEDLFTSLPPDDDELAVAQTRWHANQREQAQRARLNAEQAEQRAREQAGACNQRDAQALAVLGGSKDLPHGYEDCLGPFEVVTRDTYCGQATGWGHRLTRYIGEARFQKLGEAGELVCFDQGNWALVTLRLTREAAELVHGPIKHVERGPRGGFRWMRFGDTKFAARELDPGPEHTST